VRLATAFVVRKSVGLCQQVHLPFFTASSVRSLRNIALVSVSLWLLTISSARADLTLTLTSNSQNAHPGDLVTFSGSITNTTGVTLNASDLFLNFSGVDPTALTDVAQLLGTPNFVLPNNTFSPTVDLFTVQVSPTALPATYSLSVTVEDINNNLSNLVTAAISVTSGSTPSTLANISTRLRVETGENVLVGGFIITGTQPKKVIVRAIGPSLPVVGALSDPVLELRNSSGGLIASNDDWRTDQEAEIIGTGIPPSNNLESAIVVTLPANNSAYTAIVLGYNGATGIGLVEAYDLDHSVNSKLANISTRGLVQTGDNVLIAGTIVLGNPPQRVLVRAIGPSLNLSGKLADPILELRDGNGGLIRSNDNWRSDQEAEIMATTIPPTNDLESALVETLPAAGAAYTAIVRGVGGTTGIAVVEIYALN
jgi:hypothetical protein